MESVMWTTASKIFRTFECACFEQLSGHIAVHRDRGSGPRWVMEWRAGDVTGALPYSRASVSAVDIVLDEETEVLALHVEYFPEMIRRCPAFTAHVVHLMLDRARSFRSSDLQEEKAISLGKLAAGLAHEINNPASAAVRASRLLLAGLRDTDAAVRGLGRAALTEEHVEAVERLRGMGRDQTTDEENEPLVVMNACDPANLYGPAPDDFTTSQGHDVPRTAAGEPLTFSRLPSTWLVQHRGLPVLVAEDTAARLTTVAGTEEGLVQRALQALLDHLGTFERRVTVQTWNGQPVLDSPGRSLLESLGFYRDYPGMTWERPT